MDYDEIIEQEIESFPNKFRKFIDKEGGYSRDVQTWEYYAHIYSRTFEILARQTLNDRRHDCTFSIPLFYIGRHSMELSLKAALITGCRYSIQEIKKDRHSLLKLYKKLIRYLIAKNLGGDDDWTNNCKEILAHIDEIDPNGEIFRYPENLNGDVLPNIYFEVEGLIRAHHHISLLSDCIITALDERDRSY